MIKSITWKSGAQSHFDNVPTILALMDEAGKLLAVVVAAELYVVEDEDLVRYKRWSVDWSAHTIEYDT